MYIQYYDYTKTKEFVHDKDLTQTLELTSSTDQLIDRYTREDFLALDPSFRVPFFAEIRNYAGAVEQAAPESRWIVKKVDDEGRRGSEMATICYLIDHFVRSLSAPSILTKIEGQFYKATKIIPRSEQLSGANYTEIVELKEQLMLDLINRWIYCDEDRNPNNYLIKYNSKNNQILVAIDFLNVDLMTKTMKIEGTPEGFGWSRLEKTRYLTPLKAENFLIYDMSFFNMRFDYFRQLGRPLIEKISYEVLRYDENRRSTAKLIADNLASRIDYVHSYFSGKVPDHRENADATKHSAMGKVFNDMYDKYK